MINGDLYSFVFLSTYKWLNHAGSISTSFYCIQTTLYWSQASVTLITQLFPSTLFLCVICIDGWWDICLFGIIIFKKPKTNNKKTKPYFKNEISFRPQGQRWHVGVLCWYIWEMWWLDEQLEFRWQKTSFRHNLNQHAQNLDRWRWKRITRPQSFLTSTALDQE